MQSSIIRPGLLVSLKTSVRGGVSYAKVTLDADHVEGDGRVARWETTRQITDAEEYERAIGVRGKARSLIHGACCPSSFGLLCPQSNEDKLREAIDEAQTLANEHNKSASHSRVDVYVITGRVADSDEQAARAIGSEVRELISAMEQGVRAADPAAIREAANKARAMAGMLSNDVQEKVTAAIAEVRQVARDIVRRVEKSGVQAESIVNGLRLKAIDEARFAVLDLVGGDDADALTIPVAGRSLELDAATDAKPTTRTAPAIDLGA